MMYQLNFPQCFFALLLPCVFAWNVHAQDGHLFGGAVSSSLSMGLPLGIPPKPGDERMLSVPPDDLGVYVAWNGVATPDPKSKNPTERLLADPEIRALLLHIADIYQNAIVSVGQQDASAGAIASIGSKFLNAIVSKETAIYGRMIDGNIAGGLVCDVGDDAAELRSVLGSLAQLSGGQLLASSMDSLTIYSVKGAPMPMQITVGNRFLILGVGENELSQIIARLKAAKIAPWLSEIRAKVTVPRLANLSFVNVNHIATAIGESSRMPEELAALGADGLRSMTCATGLDDNGVVIRTHFDCDESLREKLKGFAGTLRASDVSDLARDSTLSAAMKIDSRSVVNSAIDSFELLEPRARAQIEDMVQQVAGVDLNRELIPALGDSLQVYVSPSEGGQLLTGWTAVSSLRDRAVIKKALDNLKQILVQSEAPFQIRRRKFDGKTVSYLVSQSDGSRRFRRRETLPVVPAWCIDGNRLIVSTYPQNIYALLGRETNDEVETKAIETINEQRTSFLFQMDERAVAEIIYPLVQIGAASLIGEMESESEGLVQFDLGYLPSLPGITRYFSQATFSASFDDGVQIVRRQTLPPTGIATVAVGALLVEPLEDLIEASFDKANPERATARKMRQLLYAMHTYHDVHGHLPTDILDEDGKPLLSWRIELLPWLEEYDLYDQFKLDEAWDSPANRSLVERLPAPLRSTDSQAAPGKTTFLAVRHPDSAMPGDKKLRLENISDGTSNTLALVEASDKHAIEWTKPAELNYKVGDAITLQLRNRKEKLLIGFLDGAVKTLPSSLDKNTWANLVRRNDGQRVDLPSDDDSDEAVAAPNATATETSDATPLNANELEDMMALSVDPASPLGIETSMRNAEGLMESGKFFEASVEYTRLTILDPKYLPARLGLGKSKFEAKQFKESEKAYQQCVDLSPDDHRGYLGRGKSVWVQDRNEESIPDFKKALEIEPESAEAWLYLGLAHNSLSKHEQTIASLSESIKREPDNWTANYTRANAYYSLKKNELAIADYTKAIKLRPRSSDAYLYRGFANRRLDKSEKAIADFSMRLKLEPLDKVALEYRGDELRGTGETKKAIRDYNALIGLEPNHVEALRGRAGAWLDLGNYDHAITDYSRVVALKPSKYDYVNRAIAWKEVDQLAKVIEDYTNALKLDPKYRFALAWRASAYMHQKKFVKSKADFIAAIAVEGEDDKTLLGNFSWLLAASPDDQVRDGKLALKYATKASELTNWKEAWVIDNVAAAHAEMGNFDEAIRFAKMAIEVTDSDDERTDIRSRLSAYEQEKPARIQ